MLLRGAGMLLRGAGMGTSDARGEGCARATDQGRARLATMTPKARCGWVVMG